MRGKVNDFLQGLPSEGAVQPELKPKNSGSSQSFPRNQASCSLAQLQRGVGMFGWDSAASLWIALFTLGLSPYPSEDVHSPPQTGAATVMMVKAAAPPPGLNASSCGLTSEVLGALLWAFRRCNTKATLLFPGYNLL